MRSLVPVLALVVLSVLGCSSAAPPTRCTPGALVACVCPGGAAGAQVCAADGASYGGCACGADAGGVDVSDVPPAEDRPALDAVTEDRPDVIASPDLVLAEDRPEADNAVADAPEDAAVVDAADAPAHADAVDAGCDADLANDPENCGECRRRCVVPPGFRAACMSGVCWRVGPLACPTGWADCNGLESDGCETDTSSLQNCGACGRVCGYPGAQVRCSGGCIEDAVCLLGWWRCDGIRAQCVSIHTVERCGDCSTRCVAANATPSCLNLSRGRWYCSFECHGGFGNCDNRDETGCETDLRTSNEHCGSCRVPCASGRRCVNGTCVR